MFAQTATEIEALVHQHIVPGVSYALLKNQQVHQNVLGRSALVPQPRPLKVNMLYDLASLTKVIGTTTLLLQLFEKGQLSLDTPVRKYLPEFGDDRVTIRHLMTHTSGIRGYIPNRDALPPEQLKTALLHEHVNDTFEKQVVYTDVGLLFVGWMMEKIVHEPIQQALTERVLQPLQLRHSTFQPDPRQCVPTEVTPERGVIQGVVHDPKAYTLKEHGASAGLFAPLSDLIAFEQFMLGQADLPDAPIQQKTVAKLFQNYAPNNLGRSIGWDLRFDPTDGHALLYHTGFTGTFMLIDRLKQSGLIVLSNRIHPTRDNQVFLERRDQIIQTFLQENK
ncbi:beta-lactamase family protein [Lactobacillus selangorensis]|uniref:Beta-lactamase family protein n=1 Tax=Lactobacillus selangorensis TaxID=81857 RepID=A0A0R2FL25_9LACO|nr:serine hydrolase domain-containing protein [Lactobacillus selangorensis]KRN29299.1 beta-lactamase family protein [Lactobacillus selangorensis]KRN34172.1 beta-lactamase family protein [Lactobacillus selangorensis]